MMYFLALVYCFAVGGAMAFGLWQERSYGGGNHWAYFGTPLDRLVQSLGLWGLLALCAPPILATIIAFAKSHIFWGVVLAVTCISLVGIVYLFSIMALD